MRPVGVIKVEALVVFRLLGVDDGCKTGGGTQIRGRRGRKGGTRDTGSELLGMTESSPASEVTFGA